MSRTRGAWNTKGTWIAGLALASVVVLSGYALLSGGSTTSAGSGKPVSPNPGASAPGAPGPVATYTVPKDWSEPEHWVALPRGARADEQGNPVGFPHTGEGAVAMMAEATKMTIAAGRSYATERMRIFDAYYGKGDRTPKNAETVKAGGVELDKGLARDMGVSQGQPLPAGAYLRVQVIGFKVIKKSDDEVSAWILTRAVQKNSEMAPETAAIATTLVGVQWQDGDWKQTVDATYRGLGDSKATPEPAAVAPGDQAFNSAGWTALREAS
ncbi:hypothetical protein Sros01_71910 [Streptomyces roseochromogenus]|nr:hypothetical protein Sros01_71910 [Streptomyces roseochromogenus]